MPEPKEIEDFLIRFGGAMTGAIEDAALECTWKAYGLSNVFPYIEVNPNIPPVDDLIVGGLVIPPWVIGLLVEEDGKKRGDTKAQEAGKAVKKFGEGDACYAIPMLIRITLLRATKAGVPVAGMATQPSGSQQPASTVLKL